MSDGGDETHEVCEVCGFEWAAIRADEIPRRLLEVAEGFRQVLATNDPSLKVRSQPDVWSVIEYSCHVRDCFFNLRDRIVLGLAEDNPKPHAMHTDVRIANGLYVGDHPESLIVELTAGALMLARTVVALDDDQLARPVFYPWPRPETRDLLWVAAQALHEGEHHLTDVQTLVFGDDED